jgi:hypothetical protein
VGTDDEETIDAAYRARACAASPDATWGLTPRSSASCFWAFSERASSAHWPLTGWLAYIGSATASNAESRRPARGRACSPGSAPARSRASRRTRRRSCRAKAGASRSRWAPRRRRRARPAGPAACRRRRRSARTRRAARPRSRADHHVGGRPHEGRAPPSLPGPSATARRRSHRLAPRRAAPARRRSSSCHWGSVSGPGARITTSTKTSSMSPSGGDQLLGQLEGVPAGLVVVYAYDHLVKHA